MAMSNPDEVRNAFTPICQQFQKLYNHGDAEGLASLYSEDAKILSPNMDFVEGKNAIQAFWQGALEMGVKSFKSEIIDINHLGAIPAQAGNSEKRGISAFYETIKFDRQKKWGGSFRLPPS